MKARPILFSGPMIRALLDGRKSQTRRVVKPQVGIDDRGLRWLAGWEDWHGTKRTCPYGVPGDLLWVRETWREDSPDDPAGAIYRVDQEHRMPAGGKWKPSIFMPRWASRLTLRITEVRVERLQEISYENALAEGATDFAALADFDGRQGESGEEVSRRLRWPQRAFGILWESINGPGSWEANPWVWAISFETIKANVGSFHERRRGVVPRG